MAVNLDMEKAFDKMEWNFLLVILQKLGFHEKWIHWIRLRITTSSFSILLNGSPFGLFSPSRGLRQGDPLSPFLFIIGTEVISRLFYCSLHGFKIARSCAPLSHLLFANDLVIFTTATVSEASIIQTCLDKYCIWSGQTVNVTKSNILFSKNTAPTLISAIQTILPYASTPATARHLGLPMLFGKSKTAAFSDILDKVQRKIEGWHSKTLSQAGKTVLVKVVASTIPSYVMSTFLLPDGLCHQLDWAFKKIWWGFPKDKSRNFSLKSWKSLYFPKDQGVLGFRLMKDVNFSLISKLGWKLLSYHDCLWVSLFRQKYIKYGNILSAPLSSGSWIWNGIRSTVSFLSSGVCFIPHFNSQLSIWYSPWIPSLLNFLPEPCLSSFSSSYHLVIVDLIHSSSLTWRQNLLQFLFTPSTVSEIMRIRLQPLSDSILWTPSTTSIFFPQNQLTTISLLLFLLSPPLSKVCWIALWKLNLNHRLKLFLWKMVRNIIPTKVRISFSIPHSICDTTCSLCSYPVDSLYHLFFTCPITRIVWRQSFWCLDSYALLLVDMIDWIQIILKPGIMGILDSDIHLFQIFAALACDSIWFARNKVHHDNIVPNALVLSATINSTVLEHHSA